MFLPKSITLRLFLSECVVLGIFFALVIFTFDYVVVEGFAKDRLQDFAMQLEQDLQDAVAKSNDGLTMPYHFREGRFGDIAADLQGFVLSNDKEVWRSASASKVAIPKPPKTLEINQTSFSKDLRTPNKPRYVLHKHLSLKNADDKVVDYVITISEADLFANRQMMKLNESLKESMSLLCVALLVVRFLVLRSGLKPIRRIVTDLSNVDQGTKELLDGDYPTELQGIVSNLNAFINHERVRLERQRNHLADLAHSLKTPLAILRGCTENFSDCKDTVNEQIARMDEIILYQLQRAFAKTEHTVIKQIHVNHVIQKIHTSLSKVYLDKNIHFDIQLPEHCTVYCEEGDLYEIIGNLMDNACKWCKHQVNVSIELNPRKDRRNYALVLHIEDDGVGIPVGKFNEILKRGTRADENIHGHGIGVSVVYEIIKLLGGKLDGGKSAALGGMHWRIYLP
ncbi:two-component system, OmpR family, sensor histidine kinase PhoQ [uncultured bacterium]|nr:two-component system, OmpR family, sensor histidine kinase PhoQ [uncultured bacterium]